MTLTERWTVELASGEDGGASGHVWLVSDAVAGCWFALDRSGGKRRWSRALPGANAIFAIDAGVIVGTEAVEQGGLPEQHGLVAVSLAEGKLLWRDASRSLFRRTVQRVAKLARKRAAGPESPLAVRDGKVFGRGRSVRDLVSGRVLPSESPPSEEPPRNEVDALSSELFFLGCVELPGLPLRMVRHFDPDHPLEHLRPTDCEHPRRLPLNFGAVDSGGRLVWQRAPASGGAIVPANFFGSRLLGRTLVLAECEPSTGVARLSVLSAATGEVVQRFELPAIARGLVSLQDADDRGLLVGLGSTISRGLTGLTYFEAG